MIRVPSFCLIVKLVMRAHRFMFDCFVSDARSLSFVVDCYVSDARSLFLCLILR